MNVSQERKSTFETLTTSCGGIVLLGVLVFVAWASRRPGVLLRPQFWAEDGLIFYKQAHELGFIQTILIPYGGYLHAFPRMIAGASLLVPLSFAPLVFSVAGIFAQSLPAIYLLSSRMGDVGPFGVRLLLAFLYIGLPNIWRVHGSVTSAQFHIAILCFLVLIASPPRSTWGMIVDLLVLAIGSVTGPFAMFLLPVAAIVAWRRGGAWPMAKGFVVAAGAFIVLAIVSSGRSIAMQGLGASLLGFCRMLAFQVFIPVFSGSNPSLQFSQHAQLLSVVSYTVAVAGLAFLAYAAVRGGMEIRCFLLFMTLQLAAALLSPLASMNEPQWVAMQRPGATHRYWMLPELAVAVAIVSTAATATRRAVRSVCAALVGVIVIVDIANWRMPELPDLHFANSVAAFNALPVGQSLRIPILPNWSLVLTKTERD